MDDKRDWRWVTRDDAKSLLCSVSIWDSPMRPEQSGGIWFRADPDNRGRVDMHASEFEKLFGIKVPTDRAIKVRIRAEEIPWREA